MPSNAQKKASRKYDKDNTTQLKIKLNNKTDADIISRLDQEDNKQGYIKELIRMDIKRTLRRDLGDDYYIEKFEDDRYEYTITSAGKDKKIEASPFSPAWPTITVVSDGPAKLDFFSGCITEDMIAEHIEAMQNAGDVIEKMRSLLAEA